MLLTVSADLYTNEMLVDSNGGDGDSWGSGSVAFGLLVDHQ